jgi:hypothetical protein
MIWIRCKTWSHGRARSNSSGRNQGSDEDEDEDVDEEIDEGRRGAERGPDRDRGHDGEERMQFQEDGVGEIVAISEMEADEEIEF